MKPACLIRIAPLLCCALLAGCAAAKWVGQELGLVPLNPLRQLQIAASADANSSSPTMVDLVWILNPAAQGALPATGQQWFANKTRLLAGRSSDLLVMHLEVPVGSAQQDLALPAAHGKGIAVLAYVNFIPDASLPVATLTAYRCVRIELAQATVNYVDCS